MRWLDGSTDAMDMNLGKLQEMVRDREVWCYSPVGHRESDTTWKLNHKNDAVARNIHPFCWNIINEKQLTLTNKTNWTH